MTDPRVPHPYTSIGYGQGLYGADYIDLLVGPITPTDDVTCPATGSTMMETIICAMSFIFMFLCLS